jgi:dTDP-4-amino-4,6-dideoxygalactose transaminase
MTYIPVLKPLLPTAEKLLPYLRRIDRTRLYSNSGPLCLELENRICALTNLPVGRAATASSGTSALVSAILAATGRARPGRQYAAIPSFTFSATASAVQQCGYEPLLCDIEQESWHLDPIKLADSSYVGQIGVVVPVAAFGRPIPQTRWRKFQAELGIPVVIDGAASFEGLMENPALNLGEIPVAVSFHATKTFSTGEGGAVICALPDTIYRVKKALNFGIEGKRDSSSASINGKMSEYHAAVGLAEADGWPQKVRMCERVLADYRASMRKAGLDKMLVVAPDIARCYVLLKSSCGDQARRIQERLREENIDWRLWYGGGIHQNTFFLGAQRESLRTTCTVAERVLGLPFAPDLSKSDIQRVVSAIAAVAAPRAL